MSWLDNMEDWCISRQLWWGHRIPAWYKNDEIKVCENKPGDDWEKDNDVLDTWFSSSLWPIIFADEDVISRSDNPSYLSDVLFTGYDIILFWVSRMIFQTLEVDGRPPFKKAIIHGLIRDSKGNKMSKSLNNGIDPIEVIEKWGSDALRVFLLGSSTPGQDIKFNEIKIKSAWDLNNKLFNAGKLLNILSNGKKIERININNEELSSIDKYILSRISSFKEVVKKNIEEYNLTLIFSEMNKLVFDDFTNNYLEFIKVSKDCDEIKRAINIFIELLISLHPMIPFITEKIYLNFTGIMNLKESIMLEKYMTFNEVVDKDMEVLLAVLKTSRIINSHPEFTKDDHIEIYLEGKVDFDLAFVNKYISYLKSKVSSTKKLLYSKIDIYPGVGIIYSSFKGSEEKEIKILKDEIKKKIEFEHNRAKGILSNKKFIENANEILITNEKNKEKFYKESLELIE